MLFNSIDFLIFFPIVVVLYFALEHRHRMIMLLAASYFFYMCWKPAYIILIIISTLIDYFCALKMGELESGDRKRKFLLFVSLLSNLGLLFVFKYLNFFGWTIKYFLGYSQTEMLQPVLNVLLPVGISFYTFQTLSYTIDVYRGERKAENRLGMFALYVSFFPQLVAGPIERSTRLLPQFERKVKFDYERVTDGLKLMLWGMFKKVVIADTAAKMVNAVYGDVYSYSGPSFVAATVFFAFQIYCDFSGYSDIAIGASQVLGFDLMDNFKRPYYSKSISEFWRRWHISLSTWFRDYLYIPLGGNRVSRFRHFSNLAIVFLVCGLWHGANWTFVVWGGLHGFYLVFGLATARYRHMLWCKLGLERFGNFKKFMQVTVTFALVCFGWIFFRAENLSQAWYIVSHLGSGWGELLSRGGLASIYILDRPGIFIVTVSSIAVLEFVHLLSRHYQMRHMLRYKPAILRWGIYYLLVISIILLGNMGEAQFIYFQF